MSEVSDALQIIMISGQVFGVATKLTYRAALIQMKLWNTLYLSKWKGKTNLTRLRKIKGDNLIYLNFSTEKEEKLKGIEKELKAHQILFARLPDLCGGDGRTQYAIAASDIGKVKAFLLDHKDGPCRETAAGLISAMDYAETGRDEKGKETKKLKDLETSAKEELEKEQRKTARTVSGADKEPAEEPKTDILLSGMAKLREQVMSETSQTFEQEPLAEHEKWGLYETVDGKGVVIPREHIIKAEELDLQALHPGKDAVEEPEMELYAETRRGHRKDICILDSRENYPVVDLEEVRETAKKGTRPAVSYDSGSRIMQMLNLSKQEAEEKTEGMPVFSQEKPFGTLAETIKNFPEKLREQGRQKVR